VKVRQGFLIRKLYFREASRTSTTGFTLGKLFSKFQAKRRQRLDNPKLQPRPGFRQKILSNKNWGK
jgi:penicillin-binding protein-related factor A (putative recombinase)